jgi:hypothetical protein
MNSWCQWHGLHWISTSPVATSRGGEQSGRAVADVVMGDALCVAQAQGQQRLSPVQGLDLRLLFDAEHHRFVRWVLIQAEDVPDLLDNEGVGGELAAFRLPQSGTLSAGVDAPRRSAASTEPWLL